MVILSESVSVHILIVLSSHVREVNERKRLFTTSISFARFREGKYLILYVYDKSWLSTEMLLDASTARLDTQFTYITGQLACILSSSVVTVILSIHVLMDLLAGWFVIRKRFSKIFHSWVLASKCDLSDLSSSDFLSSR